MQKLFTVLGLSLSTMLVTSYVNADQIGTTEEGRVLQSQQDSHQIEDLESKLKAVTDKQGRRLFTDWAIEEFKKIGGTVEYAEDLLSITDKDGDILFHGWAVVLFKRAGGTVEYAKELVSITDKEGNTIFHNKKDEKGKLLILGGDYIVSFKERGGTIEYAQELASIKDTKGNLIFDGWDIADFKKAGGTIEYAQKIVSIKNKNGNPVFRGKDIVQYKIAEGTFEYARELANLGFGGRSICRFQQFGMEIGEVAQFKDTKEKPNAIIIIPIGDDLGTFGRNGSFYKEIMKGYDSWVRVVSNEQEVYDAIDYVPDTELLILGGHGTKTRLRLGEYGDETNTIDISDKELEQHLQKLHHDAVIFLNSCSNAEGSKDADNLANFVISAASGRKVIASTEPFDSYEIKIKSLYPFDIEIIDMFNGKNKYYTNK